jgi:mono/diheme cytochrome c family protein
MPAAVGPGTWGNLGIGVATAGASAFAANKVLPRFAPAILTGGLVEVVMAAAYQMLGLSMKGCAGCHGVGCAGCGGVADFMSAASPVRHCEYHG